MGLPWIGSFTFELIIWKIELWIFKYYWNGWKKTLLHHLKNTEDKLNKIGVNGEIKLELLAGLINADASTGFKSENLSDDFFLKIALQYDLKSYSLELLPSASKILNKHAFKLIKEKKLRQHML